MSDHVVELDPAPTYFSKLQELKQRLQEQSEDYAWVLDRVFEYYMQLKAHPFSEVKNEMALCAELAWLCIDSMPEDESKSVDRPFNHARDIQDYYLKHDKTTITVLDQHLKLLDKYAAYHPDFSEGGHREELVSLLDERRQAEDVTIEPQTEPPSLKLEEPRQSVMDASAVYSYDMLSSRLDDLKYSRNVQLLEALAKDALNLVYENKRNYPKRDYPNLPKTHESIEATQLAIECYATYIEQLRKNKTNSFKLARALQHAAFLFRTLEGFYQRTNADDVLLDSLHCQVGAAQSQALNLKGIIASHHVIQSEATSPDEKARARAYNKSHKYAQRKGLDDLIAQYQQAVDFDDTSWHGSMISSVSHEPPTAETIQALQLKYQQLLTSFPQPSLGPFVEEVAAKIHQVLYSYIDGELPQGSLMTLVDFNLADDTQNITFNDAIFMDTPARQDLLNLIILYFDSKKTYLDQMLWSVPAYSPQSDFIHFNKFVADVRRDMYIHFFNGQSHLSLAEKKQALDSMFAHPDCLTPLTNFLATKALDELKDVMQSNILSDIGAKIEPPKAQAKPKRPNNKKKKKPKKSPVSVSRFDEIAEQYKQVMPSFNHRWLSLRSDMVDAIGRNHFEDALLIADGWIAVLKDGLSDATDEKAESEICRSLNDAYIHKAIIQRNLQCYDGAMQTINEAWRNLEPEADKTYVLEQKQKLTLERAFIYQANRDNDKAAIAFKSAKDLAEQNNSFCFYILNLSLPLPSGNSDEIEQLISKHQDVIKHLTNSDSMLKVNVYELTGFYESYEKLAAYNFLAGVNYLKQAQIAKYYGRDKQHKELVQKANGFLDVCFNVNRIICDHSKHHLPQRTFDLELALATCYITVQLLSSKSEYREHAKQHLQNARHIANLAGNESMKLRIREEEAKLKEASKVSKQITMRCAAEASHQHYKELCAAKQSEMAKIELRASEDLDGDEALMLQHMQAHSRLSQVKNIYRVLDLFDVRINTSDSGITPDHYLKFANLVTTKSLDANTEMRKYKDILQYTYQETVKHLDEETEAPPDILVQQHNYEMHYLVKLKRMFDEQATEQSLGFNTVSQVLIQHKDKQAQVAAVFSEGLKSYEKENKHFEPVDTSWCERKQLEGWPARPCIDSFSLTYLGCAADLIGSVQQGLDEKQYWIVLYLLIKALKEHKSYFENNPEAKAEAHLCIAKVMHWTLQELKESIYPDVGDDPDLTCFLTHTFSRMQGYAEVHYKLAKRGDTFFSQNESIDEAMASLLQLSLEESPQNVDDMSSSDSLKV